MNIKTDTSDISLPKPYSESLILQGDAFHYDSETEKKFSLNNLICGGVFQNDVTYILHYDCYYGS